ncbi:MAG TPA: TIGR02281 family clan AA aspartic protease [Sedimenticola thiotaurini]|uniref:TIGR02281 family clan AA aspartic protease n=1 Tax=Sedimenticola thiotaurini TaxID=1543721 RepID=A0A831W4D1_9GAMM|nr:TIGR02281 family clan AA aspartic protease [Sedimenticola thiotaurini]
MRLISANARGAVIEIDGERGEYRVGSHVGTRFSAPVTREAKIWRDRQGAYRTVGTINGRMADMLIDTGATSVAMSETEARRLGIPYRLEGERTGVRTASGSARAYAVRLDQVRVGAIELRGVDAVVIEGDAPPQVLLGMSFLKRVVMENQGALLVLRSKF